MNLFREPTDCAPVIGWASFRARSSADVVSRVSRTVITVRLKGDTTCKQQTHHGPFSRNCLAVTGQFSSVEPRLAEVWPEVWPDWNWASALQALMLTGMSVRPGTLKKWMRQKPPTCIIYPGPSKGCPCESLTAPQRTLADWSHLGWRSHRRGRPKAWSRVRIGTSEDDLELQPRLSDLSGSPPAVSPCGNKSSTVVNLSDTRRPNVRTSERECLARHWNDWVSSQGL